MTMQMISELDYCQESNPIRRILGMKCLALRMRNSERPEIIYYSILHSSQGGGVSPWLSPFIPNPQYANVLWDLALTFKHIASIWKANAQNAMRESKETNMEYEPLANLLLGL
jgi:hypothetical protein